LIFQGPVNVAMVDTKVMESAALVAIASSKNNHFDAYRAANGAGAVFPGAVFEGTLNVHTSIGQSLFLCCFASTIAAYQELGIVHNCLKRFVNGSLIAIELAKRTESPLLTFF
jgi:hypothetical protein